MRHLFRYRLKDGALIEDHVLQSVMFRHLVHAQPSWLTCATYEPGTHDRVLLLDVGDIDQLGSEPPVASYLDGLSSRCDGGPDHDVVRTSSGAGPSAIHLVGCWDPAHDQWCVPYRGWPNGVDLWT